MMASGSMIIFISPTTCTSRSEREGGGGRKRLAMLKILRDLAKTGERNISIDTFVKPSTKACSCKGGSKSTSNQLHKSFLAKSVPHAVQ